MTKTTTVLVIGAHFEEVEAEFPNICALLSAASCRVVILNPIGGWNWTSVREMGPDARENLLAASSAAAACLGCEKVVWDYPVSATAGVQDEICQRLADFILTVQPEIVLMHWPEDIHPDHRAVARYTRHVLGCAPNLVPDLGRRLSVKEVYAFQTGVIQAYNYVPDLLIKCSEESMAKAKQALDCFKGQFPADYASTWWQNVQAKAQYWQMLSGDAPAEALKYLGPNLPVDGLLLKKILGERLVGIGTDAWLRWSALQY
jgi:LmbE family N-acetylglucosaminyl deacetylase